MTNESINQRLFHISIEISIEASTDFKQIKRKQLATMGEKNNVRMLILWNLS